MGGKDCSNADHLPYRPPVLPFPRRNAPAPLLLEPGGHPSWQSLKGAPPLPSSPAAVTRRTPRRDQGPMGDREHAAASLPSGTAQASIRSHGRPACRGRDKCFPWRGPGGVSRDASRPWLGGLGLSPALSLAMPRRRLTVRAMEGGVLGGMGHRFPEERLYGSAHLETISLFRFELFKQWSSSEVEMLCTHCKNENAGFMHFTCRLTLNTSKWHFGLF